MTIVRRIAGIKFERTYNGESAKSYDARREGFHVGLNCIAGRWNAHVTSTHFTTSLRGVSLKVLSAWLDDQRNRHFVLAAQHEGRLREVRRARNRRGTDGVVVVIGAYLVGVFVGAVTATAKVVSTAA